MIVEAPRPLRYLLGTERARRFPRGAAGVPVGHSALGAENDFPKVGFLDDRPDSAEVAGNSKVVLLFGL